MTDKFFETYKKAINVAKQRFGLNFRALRVTHWEKGNHTCCEVSIELNDPPVGLKVSDIVASSSWAGGIPDPIIVLHRLIGKWKEEISE